LLCLAGAFLCSISVVPVLTSYWVRPRARGQHAGWLPPAQRAFAKLLAAALRRRVLTVGAALGLFALALALFARGGAEFIPQLDEGSLVIEARRLPGIALSESVATGTRVERTLLEIPEVQHVVTKTGAPEVATDPMGIELSDIFISLVDPERFRPGVTKQTLAREVSARLERYVPEIAGAISQPIEQRTNELIAGVRSDVAVLVYGPDLARLGEIGARLERILRDVPGVMDLRVEQVAGLRYLRVTPERAKLARYGLRVSDINQLTETMAVGHAVGVVLEGERRFGIVVKTAHGFDGELEALRSLPLKSVTGQMVSLGDVATLEFRTGPAEVGRENQARRLTVEFNVRGRDLISVVHDAQRRVADRLPARAGYRVEWGGQFEHYRAATQRLSVVVPIALALIVFLLWLAFRSLPIALLIFANVPFAIIGGVFALYGRGLPFSISAGVGFIALFGVATLNGLVLVAFSRQLEAAGVPRAQAIQRAAEARLRPVLMTALVAALGFVPMALSTAPGSEVQRPLATVVIGGVVSAMLLTLLLLPVLYAALLGRRPPTSSHH
jgi:cobalt-zinc-cadmium resistance protein CzcA